MILDLALGSVSGLDVAERLPGRPAATPVIFVTGSTATVQKSSACVREVTLTLPVSRDFRKFKSPLTAGSITLHSLFRYSTSYA